MADVTLYIIILLNSNGEPRHAERVSNCVQASAIPYFNINVN